MSRSCLNCDKQKTNDEDFQYIFDELGNELQLSSLLEQYFQLQINQDDNEQAQLCLECMEKLVHFIDLDEHEKQQQQHELFESVEILAEVIYETTTETQELKADLSTFDSSDTYFEEYETITNASDEHTDVASLHEDVVYDSNDYLDACIESDLQQMNFDTVATCIICNVQLNSYREILQHIIQKHKEDLNGVTGFNCTVNDCSKKLTSLKLLTRHIVLQHVNLKNLQIIGSCIYCNYKFQNFLQFNKHSCSHLEAKTDANKQCVHCGKCFVSIKRCIFHMQFHLPQHRPKICFICDTVFDDEMRFFEHVGYEHPSSKSFVCTNCDLSFKQQTQLEAHLKLCRKLECAESEISLIATTLLVHVCSNCGILAAREEHLNCCQAAISKEFVSIAYACENCGLDFKTAQNLVAHRSSIAHNIALNVCCICTKEFSKQQDLDKHMLLHDSHKSLFNALPLRKIYLCHFEKCHKEFDQCSFLHKHKTKAHKPLMRAKQPNVAETASSKTAALYVCQYCSKQCKSKMSLAVHLARSHNKDNLACAHCTANFKTKNALQEHIDYMHVPIKCDKCYKVIKNRRNYETHERAVHQQMQRYFCRICCKGFYYRTEREAHEKNVHANIVYKCADCSFSTNYEHSLNLHIAQHNNELPFKCTLCEKGFGRKSALKLHVLRHKAEKPFLCSERLTNGCSATFYSNFLLNRHIEKCHLQTTNSARKNHKLNVKNAKEKKQKLKESLTDAQFEINDLIEEDCAETIKETNTNDDEILYV